MKDLIIGDCHFGIKSNSMQWLEYQLTFFKEQIIPEIETGKYNRVIFLGDLFDIRYSINQYIGYEVKCMFRQLSNTFPNLAFYIIAGNHDYYSPDENYLQFNAYNLIFGYEFTSIHTNVHIITEGYLIEDETVFASWYSTENHENFQKMMEDIKSFSEENKPMTMYCHSDLSTWSLDGRLELKPKDLTVISGHIHNAQQDNINKLYNVGSMFSITFSDVDNKKYFYRYDTYYKKFEQAFENIITPRFVQYYNEDIFTLNQNDLKNCYVRIFINSDNINKASYIERLSEIKKNFDYLYLKIQTISSNLMEEIEGNGLNTNITDYIESNIPENLKDKYELIKDIVNQKEEETII